MPIDMKSLAIGKANGGGGGDITTEKLSVTKNGTYPAPSGKAYTPVVVSVPTIKLEELNATENGSYEAESGKGYDKVEVDVQPKLQSKTANANGTVLPDLGFDGLSKVDVAVPEKEINLQNKTATENGTYSADEGYDGIGEIVVNVEGGGGYPEPVGTIEITENGTYDVKDKAEAVVEVQGVVDRTMPLTQYTETIEYITIGENLISNTQDLYYYLKSSSSFIVAYNTSLATREPQNNDVAHIHVGGAVRYRNIYNYAYIGSSYDAAAVVGDIWEVHRYD